MDAFGVYFQQVDGYPNGLSGLDFTQITKLLLCCKPGPAILFDAGFAKAEMVKKSADGLFEIEEIARHIQMAVIVSPPGVRRVVPVKIYLWHRRQFNDCPLGTLVAEIEKVKQNRRTLAAMLAQG